jgi:hypothetical protein
MFEQYVGTCVEEQVGGDAARLMTHERFTTARRVRASRERDALRTARPTAV